MLSFLCGHHAQLRYALFFGNAAFLFLSSTCIPPLEQSMVDRGKFGDPSGCVGSAF